MSTKPAAKTAGAAKGGRPRLGDRPMTSTERSKRSRAKRRQQRQAAPPPVEEVMAGVTSESVVHDLIAERRITSGLHRTIALKIVNALATNNVVLAEKLLSHLPAVCAEVREGSTHGSAGARQHVVELIMSAIAADQVEAEQAKAEGAAGKNAALQAAEARIAALEDEVLHLRGVKPRQLPPPAKPAATAEPAQRINGGPPVAKSGEETKRQMDAANEGARASTFEIMTAPGRAWEPQPTTEGVYGWIDRLNRRAY